MEILLQQNAQLEKEITRLCAELDEVTGGVMKRGYLYKWRDREISFASKWALRYFVLKGTNLSYYLDDRDLRPRKTVDLQGCIIKDEGIKKGGKFHVFGIYYDNNQDSEVSKQTNKADESESESYSANTVLLRLSCEVSAEANQWIDMLQSSCSRPDQSIYHVMGEIKPSDLIPNGNGNCNGDGDDDDDDVNTVGISEEAIKRVKSSSDVLLRSRSRSLITSSENSHSHFVKMPSPPKSSGTTSSSSSIRSRSKKQDFPATKAIHIEAVASPLSEDSRPGQSYRGFFNLGVIILVISNFRLILDNLKKIENEIQMPNLKFSKENIASDFYSVRPEFVLLSWLFSITMAYLIELGVARRLFSSRMGTVLHIVMGALNLVLPILWVWVSLSHPGYCMIYLFQSTIIWMKLISYAHVNRDVRKLRKVELAKKEAEAEAKANMNMNSYDNNAKPLFTNIFAEIKDLEQPYLQYPANITFSNILYFSLAPTLCYQLNYPRSPKIRRKYVLTLLFRLAVTASLIIYFVEQYIKPTLETTIENMNAMNAYNLFENLLKLSIPNTYVWLASFYFFFHLWLNLLAELTRFGDRQFYKDWWNARTIDKYWRTWNLPVHNWLVRHLYYPLVRAGASKTLATFCVFFFSAAFHEIIISIPFRHVSLHAFYGMLLQAPLVYLTKHFDKLFDIPFVGNAFFWLVFCVIGQPMGIIMYYYDLWKFNPIRNV